MSMKDDRTAATPRRNVTRVRNWTSPRLPIRARLKGFRKDNDDVFTGKNVRLLKAEDLRNDCHTQKRIYL